MTCYNCLLGMMVRLRLLCSVPRLLMSHKATWELPPCLISPAGPNDLQGQRWFLFLPGVPRTYPLLWHLCIERGNGGLRTWAELALPSLLTALWRGKGLSLLCRWPGAGPDSLRVGMPTRGLPGSHPVQQEGGSWCGQPGSKGQLPQKATGIRE